jgi:hypothetical protein
MTTFFQLYVALPPLWADWAAGVAARAVPGTCAPGLSAQEQILQPCCANADKITANDIAQEVLAIFLAPSPI